MNETQNVDVYKEVTIKNGELQLIVDTLLNILENDLDGLDSVCKRLYHVTQIIYMLSLGVGASDEVLKEIDERYNGKD